jgi:ABC-type microcin C transport system permease subunit YejE
MKVNRTIILTLFIISLVVAYDQINDYKEIMAYYEDYSYMPIIHVYHNRHFSKSKQFLHFVEVVEEAEYETKQYSKIVFTDCEI